MNIHDRTTLPARLTGAAKFRCAMLRLDLSVSQCAGRYGGNTGPGDPCHGCPHGERTSLAMRGQKDPAEMARDAANARERHHGKLAIIDAAVLAVVADGGEHGTHTGAIGAALPQHSNTQLRYALGRLADVGLIVRGERLNRSRGFAWRLAKAKSEAA